MTHRDRPAAILVAATLLLSPVASGPAAAIEDPKFRAYVPDPVIEPGGEVTLAVNLVNDARNADDLAKTARNVRAEMRSGETPIAVGSGTKLLGEMPDGEATTVEFRLDVPRNVASGTYTLPVRVTYEVDGDRKRRTVDVEVRVEDRARFAVVAAGTTAPIGDTGTVELVVENTGSEAARDATVALSAADGGFSFGSTPAGAEGFVGRLAPGERTRVAVEARVAPDAVRRNYSITATVDYLDPGGERHAERLTFGVRPRPRQSFEVVGVSSNASVGGSGTLVLEIRNAGPDAAYDSAVTVESADADVGFAGGAPEATSYAGRWEAGEVDAVAFRIDVAERALRRNYTVSATVRYEGADGRERTPRTLLAAVRPLPEQTFEARDVESSLRVGRSGNVSARLINTGPSTVEDVVVTVRFDGTNLTPRVPARTVGELAPGEAAAASFAVDVPEGTGAGTYRVAFEVRYETAANEVRQAARIAADAEVSGWRPAFAVEPAGATFQVDSAGTLALSVTNDRDERVSDLAAVVSAADPLSSDDPSAFVPALAPGESARVTFHLDVSSDAIPKAHPVTVELAYTDGEGVARTAGPYRVAVTVVAQPGSGFPVLPAVAMVVVIAVAAGWWWRRRE